MITFSHLHLTKLTFHISKFLNRSKGDEQRMARIVPEDISKETKRLLDAANEGDDESLQILINRGALVNLQVIELLNCGNVQSTFTYWL